MNIIETQNLTKSYADFTAVSNVNLHIPKEQYMVSSVRTVQENPPQ